MLTPTSILALGLAACAIQRPVLGDVPVVHGEKLLNEKYHTPLTKDALLSALRDDDGAVRALAAAKLVAAGDRDAAPFILAALARESIPGVRISLALDAAKFGESQGATALKGMCGDPSLNPGIRMLAAQAMDQLDSDDCLPEILGVLRTPDDLQATAIALNSLIYHHNMLAAEQGQELLATVPKFLKSRKSAERIAAAEVLGKFGDVQSISELRDALAVEQEENCRRAMTEAVAKLEKKGN